MNTDDKQSYQRALYNRAIEISEGHEIKHGKKERNFEAIANMWSAYLNTSIDSKDVCLMMAMLKIARIRSEHNIDDSFIDGVNYFGLAYEMFMEENESGTENKSQ